MKEIFDKIANSFNRATRGEETLSHMIWWWGILGYLFAYFIAGKLILAIDVRFIDVFISLMMVLYFSWHAYAVKKCAPKKPKLTDEERKKLKEERHKHLGRTFMRKLLLQESLTRWDPAMMTMMVDLLCITHFARYFFK